MARKAKDLYTVLQARRKVGKGSFRGRSPGSGHRPQSLTEVLGNFWSWFTGRGRPEPRKAEPKKTAAQTPSGIVLSGPSLAAIVFASLGLGFLLGDMIGLGSGEAGLRAAEKDASAGVTEPGGVRPGPVGAGIRLGAEEETRVLADQALFVTAFGAGERPEASSLAEWLRREGIETARVYLFWKDDGSGSSHWLVVAYFDGATPPDALVRQLRDLPANPEHPQFEAQRNSLADWPTPVQIR